MNTPVDGVSSCLTGFIHTWFNSNAALLGCLVNVAQASNMVHNLYDVQLHCSQYPKYRNRPYPLSDLYLGFSLLMTGAPVRCFLNKSSCPILGDAAGYSFFVFEQKTHSDH